MRETVPAVKAWLLKYQILVVNEIKVLLSVADDQQKQTQILPSDICYVNAPLKQIYISTH